MYCKFERKVDVRLYVDRYVINNLNLGRFEMENSPDKIEHHEYTKKLSYVVVFLSMFVIVLFSLAPFV
jgi:hypothetical protein